MSWASPTPCSIAVVGCGAWGRNLVRNFQALGALDAVVDVEPSAREIARRMAPSVHTGSSLDDVLSRRDITGVAIATPAETHVALCHLALDRGLDVFCEKPLALAYADAERVARRADAARRVLMVGHILEYHPGVRALHALVDDGVIGELRHVNASRLHVGGAQRETSPLWALGPHDLAVILRLAREEPSHVSTHAGGPVANGFGVADLDLRFPSGLTAHVQLSVIHHFKEQKLVVVGSKGTAIFDDVCDTLTLHEDGREPRIVHFAPDEPLRVECEAFLRAIATRRPPTSDGSSALEIIRVLERAEAGRHGEMPIRGRASRS